MKLAVNLTRSNSGEQIKYLLLLIIYNFYRKNTKNSDEANSNTRLSETATAADHEDDHKINTKIATSVPGSNKVTGIISLFNAYSDDEE